MTQVSSSKKKPAIGIENSLVVGAIQKNTTSYSTHFEKNFNVDGSPSEYNLEEIFNAPQDHISEILGYSKYCYRKHGVIMRVVNIIRDFASSGFDLSFPRKDKRTQEIINNYNERIDVEQLIKEMVFELALTGNLVCYDRDGERVDIYPINTIEVLPLVENNKQVVAYKVLDNFGISNKTYGKEIDDLVNNAYPQEINDARKKNDEFAILDSDYSYFAKINSSQYERYGTPIILPAFEDLAHKTLLKEAEKSTALAIIEKILCIKVGDKENRPTENLINEYNELFNGLNGSVRVTVPHYVDLKWIEPESTIFGQEKFIQVDTDILNTLGVSLTLIRGEGSGSYSDGMISFTGLTKTIETIRSQIPEILQGLYKKELERQGVSVSNAPKVKFKEVIIDKDAKLNLIKELFTVAGLPYQVLYEEFGYDYDYIKLIRQEENKEDVDSIFELHSQPFQGEQTAKPSGGQTKNDISGRSSDKNRSNNKQPRP